MTADGILIFTDGAARRNPGPGGWGAIVVIPDDQVVELGGAAPHTTNNKMEMTGAVKALEQVRDVPGKVSIYTDSAYLVRGITQWIHGWRRKGWRTADGEPVLNRDLWERLSELVGARGKQGAVAWYHVPGHAGVAGNERCDEIATLLADGRHVDLYRGPLAGYDVDIGATERARILAPSTRGRSAGGAAPRPKGAYSYLSLVGGELRRHASWAECEQRVKGVSGAKFKKAGSSAEEESIAHSWGCTLPGSDR